METNKKYEKIMSQIKKNVKFCYTGKNAIDNFKAKYPNYVTIKEEENRLTAQVLIFSPIKYGELVSLLVRTAYSIDQELAILRQRDDKPDEFAEYNAFVEKCKADAKAFVAERG